MALKLFDGSDSDDNDDASEIHVDKEFARRYEHNKKREDLQRLEELKKKGLVSDSSDDTEETDGDYDDDAYINSSKKNLAFFDALVKIKNQDPVLKDKDAELFVDDSEESEKSDDDDDEKENEKNVSEGSEGRKAVYLKDMVAKQLIECGPEFEDDNDKETENISGNRVMSYNEEQEEMRKAFLDAVAAEESEGDLLRVKEKDGDDEDGTDAIEVKKKLDEYFGGDEDLDANSSFLKEFFLNKMWIDKKKGEKCLGDELEEVSVDEDEIEKQEDYERDYNFRFEENAGDRVLGYERTVDGSVRKKANARKVQRERREERRAMAELQRQEEVRHLKNLKKKEHEEKIKKLQEVAGIGEGGICGFNEEDLEREYDPEEHKRRMEEMFGEDYYNADDVDAEFGNDIDDFEKPDFDKENELLGLPEGWDGSENGGRNSEAAKGGKRKRKRKKAALGGEEEEKYNRELEDELCKLDYEDAIGDLKTRFKYRKVNPKRYGLATEEILMMDDKELNQYLPLKKLAPYREQEWKVPRVKTYQQKLKNRALLLNGRSEGKEREKNKKKKSLKLAYEVGEDVDVDKGTNATDNLSRRAKRRHRQAETKLPPTRFKVYHEIALSKTKSKKRGN